MLKGTTESNEPAPSSLRPSDTLPMVNADTFCSLAERLTGTTVKGVTKDDIALLSELLADDQRQIDHSQLNELLLLENKDRVAAPMFRYFFGETYHVGQLPVAIERYQKIAMLQYGNFVFAYRTLSRITSDQRK